MALVERRECNVVMLEMRIGSAGEATIRWYIWKRTGDETSSSVFKGYGYGNRPTIIGDRRNQKQVYYKFPFDFRTGAGQGSAIVNLDVVFSIPAASLSQLLSIIYSGVSPNASYHDPSYQNLYAPSNRLRQATGFKSLGRKVCH